MPRGGVLAAINGGHNDHQVLTVAVNEAKGGPGNLTLLCVIVVGWDRRLNQSEEVALHYSERVIQDAERYLESSGVSASAKQELVQARSAGGGIVELAHRMDAELIVIGTRHFLGDEGLELGPTATYVLKHAACRVLAAHDPLA